VARTLLTPMTPSEINNAYTSLWMRFSTTCHSASFNAVADQAGFILKTVAPKKVQVESLIYLKDWRYKSVSPAKHVDILVKSAEVFSCDDNCMIESKVKVTYFQTHSMTATPILAIHYDYDLPPNNAHPIFHAQLGTTHFEQKDIDKIGFRKKIQKAATPLYGNLRIPTAYMNLASVLLGLVADHLPPKFFDKFLTDLRQNNGLAWSASCASLRTSLNGGGFLHSHHWYDRIPNDV